MADTPRIAYVQSRLQARLGELPRPEDWRVAEASADLSHYLEALRRTGLQRWVGALAAGMAPEAIERELRAAWKGCVDEVAGWVPDDWRPAVSWLRWLPYLPAVDHLLGPRSVPPWMRADPVLRPLAFDDPARRRQALEGLGLEALDPGDGRGPRVHEAWRAEWQRRLPDGTGHDRATLELIARRVENHLAAMRDASGPGNPHRQSLREQLVRMFRRHTGHMGAVFAHVGITGLDLERARAGILARRLMPGRTEGRSWA